MNKQVVFQDSIFWINSNCNLKCASYQEMMLMIRHEAPFINLSSLCLWCQATEGYSLSRDWEALSEAPELKSTTGMSLKVQLSQRHERMSTFREMNHCGNYSFILWRMCFKKIQQQETEIRA